MEYLLVNNSENELHAIFLSQGVQYDQCLELGDTFYFDDEVFELISTNHNEYKCVLISSCHIPFELSLESDFEADWNNEGF